LRIVRILPIRNLRDLDSSADHVLAAVVASGFCGKIGLFHEFISGTHQAFASTPIVEDASTWCRRTQPIPGDAILLAKLLGAIHDRCVINFCHPHAPCLRQAYWIEAQGAIIGSRAVTLKFSNIGILQLLERLTIALFAVLLVAALVLVIKYDMQRTAAAQPGRQLVPRQRTDPWCAELTVSGCAAAVTPSFAVANLLGRVARFKLAQRVVDRGKGYRDPVVL
jgi:preprotein translocase subunit SecG